MERTDLIGYTSQRESLITMCVSSHAPSGFLITGPPHIGKSTLAMSAAAHFVNATDADSHSDISVFDPDPTFKNKEDEQIWKKDLVRTHLVSWLHHVHMKPSTGSRVAAVLLRTEKLSQEACQLLLKAIEDGSPSTRFLLTAQSSDLLPATIRSRTTVIRLTPLRSNELASELIQRGVSESIAHEYAILSGGRPGLALRFASDKELVSRYQSWLHIINNLSTLHIGQISSFASTCSKRSDAEEFLRLLQSVIRERMLSNNVDSNIGRTVRRTREATAMMRSHVPPQLALEYALL